eukprot:c8933_g1_i1.p1 GENE.c8933_g1_i1~~c8933_g1_i1.p1  ORF type:complete len:527 (+),score=81.16 c8933_g1_i1:123-1583(+)
MSQPWPTSDIGPRESNFVSKRIEAHIQGLAQRDVAREHKRSIRIMERLKSTVKRTPIRILGWILTKLWRFVFPNGIHVRNLENVVRALKGYDRSPPPIFFVPTHRSHVDYLLLSYCLFSDTNIKVPHIAAGDNLRLPLIGWFLNNCGAFFIRRPPSHSATPPPADHLYRACLADYVTSLLAAGENMEVFAEGGRSRTGAVAPIKTGLLRAVVESVADESVPDVLVCPVSITYERVLETREYVSYALGKPKVKETFFGTLKVFIRSIFAPSALTAGTAYVAFDRPFSLRSFLTATRSNTNRASAVDSLLGTWPSTGSLSSLDDVEPPNNNTLVFSEQELTQATRALGYNLRQRLVARCTIPITGMLSYLIFAPPPPATHGAVPLPPMGAVAILESELVQRLKQTVATAEAAGRIDLIPQDAVNQPHEAIRQGLELLILESAVEVEERGDDRLIRVVASDVGLKTLSYFQAGFVQGFELLSAAQVCES